MKHLQRCREIAIEREGIATMLRSLGDRIKALQEECTHESQWGLLECRWCGFTMPLTCKHGLDICSECRRTGDHG